jgi:hypothetical protein
MSENISNKNVRDDEIDLLDLFRRMGKTLNNWLRALGRAFLLTTVFLFKRWLPLGLSVVAGIGASYLLKTTTASFFTSDMILTPNAVASDEMIPYVNRLHMYCSENNTIALSDALSLNAEHINNIIDISAFWIIDKNRDGIPDIVDYKDNHDVYDTINIRMQNRFDIRVKVKTPQELSMLRTGILSFINRDSLFQKKNRLRLRQNSELLTRLNYDILQLDSLQKVKYFEETRNRQPQNGGQMVFLQEQKTQLIYSDIYGLYTTKQHYESEQTLYKDIVTVLSDFSLPAKRDNGGFYYGKKLIPLFFLITLFILVILANKKKLKEVFNKYE